MRAGLYTALIFACVLWSGVSARASVFCAADVGFMAPWDFAKDAPSESASSLHYAYELQGDAAATLSGHLVLVTETKAYKVAFDRVQLVARSDDPKEFRSDGAFVSLPEPGAVRYAWVDDTTDASGKTTTCPSFPYQLPALTPQQRAEMTPKHASGSHGILSIDSSMAQFIMDLPQTACPQPFRNVEPIGPLPETTNYYDQLITSHPEVDGRVDVDSDGKPVDIEILKSSGSIAFDQDAREMYSAARYRPQLFRCTPVVSSYYFMVKYSPR